MENILTAEQEKGALLPGALSLRANFSWTFLGEVVYNGSQWGMLMALAKLGDPAKVGEFALGLALTAPVIMFTNMQLRTVLATDAKSEYSFGDYLGLRICMAVLGLFVIFGIALTGHYPLETGLAIAVIGIAKVIESISDVFFGLLQKYERMDRVAASKIIKGPISLIALSVGVYLSGTVLWGAVAMALVWLAILVFFDIPNCILLLKRHRLARASEGAEESTFFNESLQPRWRFHSLKDMFLLSLPLGIITLLLSLSQNFPRYFIEAHFGTWELGIFAAIAYIMSGERRLVQVLGFVVTPRLSRTYADGNFRGFRRLLLRLVGIGILLGGTGVLVALVIGKPILSILYEPEYANYNDIFVKLMIAATLTQVHAILGYVMTATRRLVVQLPLNAIMTAILLLACYLLIPSTGLTGATWALIIGSLFGVIGSTAVTIYILRDLKRMAAARISST